LVSKDTILLSRRKIGKNSWKLTGKEYLRVDKNTIDDKLGIYKEQCNHCHKEFRNKSGLASHQQWCKAGITAKQKREIEKSVEIKSSYDTTVFVANVTKNAMPSSTDGWRTRKDIWKRRKMQRVSVRWKMKII
jgi:hypothetical protein